MIIRWNTPSDQGSSITGYRVYLRRADLTYDIEHTYCDASESLSTECQIPLLQLRSDPFNLVLGNAVYTKVIAVNAYGDSPASPVGEGALIVLVPDAPVDLLNDPTVTNNQVIRLSWSDGASNGGATIIDYRIVYDQSTGLIVTMVEGLTQRSFVTPIGLLTEGRVYQFKVDARNSVGYSQ